ncbi:hypothetical protein [Halosolutus halophilus]|nr:hypothetical protein [Halosolutus halophilus]
MTTNTDHDENANGSDSTESTYLQAVLERAETRNGVFFHGGGLR